VYIQEVQNMGINFFQLPRSQVINRSRYDGTFSKSNLLNKNFEKQVNQRYYPSRKGLVMQVSKVRREYSKHTS